MNIGVITQNSRTVKKDGEDVQQQWLEMAIRPPFMSSATFSVHPNNKTKDNEPDYNIWYNFSRKGENYRGTKVGSLWKKKSKDGKTEYFSGHIENPIVANGKMYITVFKAKPMGNEKAEDINWIYDVIWQPYQANNNNNQSNGYTPPVQYDQYNNSSTSQEQIADDASYYM